MSRSVLIGKDTDKAVLSEASKQGRAVILPFRPNTYVWMISNGIPLKTLCMDVGLYSIQLNGRWFTWEEIENLGGVYESEFDALRSL